MDEDCQIPAFSDSMMPSKRSAIAEEDLVELLWHNGGVVMQSQAQRANKKSPHSKSGDAAAAKEIRASASSHQRQTEDQLFVQEDELASWLHYPLNDARDFCADLLFPAPCVASTAKPPPQRGPCTSEKGPPPQAVAMQEPAPAPAPPAQRPPVPPARRTEVKTSIQSFGPFSMPKRPTVDEKSRPSTSTAVLRESTVVDSCETPTAARLESRMSEPMSTYLQSSGTASQTLMGTVGAGSSYTATGTSRDVTTTCDATATSSPGDSSTSPEPSQKSLVEDRKRKGRETDTAECHSEDVKRARGSASTKRSRAAEVHNLSERRRRDRINERMRALQELIPRCNKSDKASMLDEAIDYLKSLQLQVQMMAMGCGMVPMMFPGVQSYMSHMGMGMGMGMNMNVGGMGVGMDLGANQPMMPFTHVLAGSAMPPQAAAAHLGPRFPVPTFPVPQVPPPDRAGTQAATQQDVNSHRTQNPSHPKVPGPKEPN